MEGDGRRGNGAAIGVSPKENDVVVVDGQISEDEKMDKFYALIKSYKEARERRRIELERPSTQEEGVDKDEEERRRRRKRKRTTKPIDRAASIWIPAFKWEDFAENSQIKFRNPPVSLPTSFDSMQGGNCIGRREEVGGGLDLRLRL